MLEQYQSEHALKKQMSDGYIYYMLLSDDKLAGYMCIHLHRDHVFLERLYIKAEYRRQGLAKKTLSHLESIFKQPEFGFGHIKKICLKVERENSFALNVYERLGFKTVREQDTDIGSGFVCRDYLMERRI